MDRVSCLDHLGSRWHLYCWLVFDRLKGMLHKHTYWLTDLLYVNNAPLRDTCWRGRWGALVLVMLLLSYSQLSLQLAPVSPSLPCSSQYQSQCPETNDGQQHSEIISGYVGAWRLLPSSLSPLSTGYNFLQQFPSAARAGWGSSVHATELAGKKKVRARVTLFIYLFCKASHFSHFYFPCSSETPAHPATGTLLLDVTPQRWLLYKEVNGHAAVYRQWRQAAQRVPSCIDAAPWACSGEVVLSSNHWFLAADSYL